MFLDTLAGRCVRPLRSYLHALGLPIGYLYFLYIYSQGRARISSLLWSKA